MFGHLFGRGDEGKRIATALYGMIVAQARTPAFYASLGVPDTIRGRFEMVVLHTVLVVDSLGRRGEVGDAIGQRVFDRFCADMDQSLRELGVGDLSVPRRMRQMAQGYYGRAEAYRRGLAAGNATTLAQAIGRNVFNSDDAAPSAVLARYALAAAGAIANAVSPEVSGAALPFPDPAAFAEPVVAI